MKLILYILICFYLCNYSNAAQISLVESDDRVDYTGWKVMKVQGFERSIHGTEHPLMDLEENPNVRVLQEHKEDGYFHVAVSGDAVDEIKSLLSRRGLNSHDMNVDLAGLIKNTMDTAGYSLRTGGVTFNEYMPFDKIEAYLKEVASTNPGTVTLESIGKTLEGRDIHMVTISKSVRQARSVNDWEKVKKREFSQPRAREILNDIISYSDIELDQFAEQLESKSENKLDSNISHKDFVMPKITYEVLRKIIESESFDSQYRPQHFIDNISRLRRSLKDEELKEPRTIAEAVTRLDDKSKVTVPASMIVTDNLASNQTIVLAIWDSVLLMSQRLKDNSSVSQEELKNLLSSIRENPVIQDIEKDTTGTKQQLITIMENVADFLKLILDENRGRTNIRPAFNKPAILIDGGIHAREWISPAFLLYTLKQLVEDDSELTKKIDWYLIPVLNPDGYVYSWTNDRLWRKNRNENSNHKCKGVDLNRNFGYKFGGSGSSSSQCSDIFRGTKGFSERESVALRDIITQEKHRLKAYISVHSYGQMLLHPWGYTRRNHKRNVELSAMGQGMSAAIRKVNGKYFRVGSAAQTLYAAAGGSDDYVSSEGVPYSYTFELRDSGTYGFVLPKTQILPGVTETWAAVEYLGGKIIEEEAQGSSTSNSLHPRLEGNQLRSDGLFKPFFNEPVQSQNVKLASSLWETLRN